MPTLLKYVLWPLLLYTAYCGLLFLLQRQIVFPRYQIPQPAQDEQPIDGLEKFWLDTDSGKVEAWFIPPDNFQTATPAPAVIFGHGNGELIDFWPGELRKFNRLGVAVMMVEYPGYGRSAGTPSEQSISHTFVAAYDMLVSRKDVDPSRIVFWVSPFSPISVVIEIGLYESITSLSASIVLRSSGTHR